ncbi:hypothetical protein GCM10009102_25980 [Sphingomonas insulae]|uniref:Uncharacterized protein n=1 Tax=Sphingomonas insulae TaxID=424800 RepID=A0ABN1HYB6_9SPHN
MEMYRVAMTSLASRPGRVDEAIEVANPDRDCRARLVSLYGRKLILGDGAIEAFVNRSEGGSAAFVKEMVRRLTQAALTAGRGNRVEDGDVDTIMDQAMSTAPLGRRIVGLPDCPRAGRQAPPFDACG